MNPRRIGIHINAALCVHGFFAAIERPHANSYLHCCFRHQNTPTREIVGKVATRASEVYGTVRILLTLNFSTEVRLLPFDIYKTQQYKNRHDIG